MTVLATTELEAVNIMLATITEAAVTTLDDDTIEDAQMALTTLREVSKELQNQGWHFNTDYDFPLNVNGDGKIPYPVSAAHVDAMPSENKDLVKRGGFLYDRKNRTFTFPNTTSVKCQIVWLLDFEDLPEAARSFIALRAARRFAKNVMGDEATVQFAAEDERMARMYFVADDMRRGDHSMLRDSYSTFRVINRRSPWPV